MQNSLVNLYNRGLIIILPNKDVCCPYTFDDPWQKFTCVHNPFHEWPLVHNRYHERYAESVFLAWRSPYLSASPE